MKRDMELVRMLLFAIEEKHIDVAIHNVKIEGFDLPTIAYHCKIMYEAGLISDYKSNYGGNRIIGFGIGGLTWVGQDYLELIRDDSRWELTMKKVEEAKLPKTIKFVAEVAGKFTGGIVSAMNE